MDFILLLLYHWSRNHLPGTYTKPMASTSDELRRLVEQADTSWPPANETLWHKVIDFAAAHHDAIAKMTRAPYVLGLAWYNCSASTPGRDEMSEKWFKAALERKPDDWLAVLYLGHLAFDRGDFQTALEYFSRIPSAAFAGDAQEWRDVKVKELCVCCHFHLGHPEAVQATFREYLEMLGRSEATSAVAAEELPQLLVLAARGVH